jgi:hypothetical protein
MFSFRRLSALRGLSVEIDRMMSMKAWFEAWVAGLLALVMSGVVVAGEDDEGRERVIDTGLTELITVFKVGAWLDNDHVILNTLQDGKGDKKNRISVIYDVKSRRFDFLRSDPMFCMNAERGVIGFWRDGVLLLARIEGKDLIDIGVGDSWLGCRSGGKLSGDFLIKPLTNSDGYIEYGVAGRGVYDGPAFLVGSDGVRKPLKIHAGLVGFVEYFSFMDKYLLDNSDGRIKRQGNRDLYLMSPAGDISTIPYPVTFVDKVLTGEQFNFLLPVKSGLLIYKGSKSYVSGLYLLKDGQHKKIWGGRGHYMKGVILSPDGCRIAFASFHDGFLGVNINQGAIKILDVCR